MRQNANSKVLHLRYYNLINSILFMLLGLIFGLYIPYLWRTFLLWNQNLKSPSKTRP